MDENILPQVELDLLADRSRLPGAIANWEGLTDKKRRRWIVRLSEAEHRRTEFEEALSREGLDALWATFPVTEQREILSTIDYLRFWPRRWAIRDAINRGVKRGSDYKRKAGP
jgi:hypothetical protein